MKRAALRQAIERQCEVATDLDIAVMDAHAAVNRAVDELREAVRERNRAVCLLEQLEQERQQSSARGRRSTAA